MQEEKQLVPKLRFSEFKGKWNVIKFDKYCNFQQGVQVDIEKQKSEPFEDYTRFLRIENYTQDSKDFRFIPNIYSESKMINKNDIVVVRYGATAGFIGRGKKGILANNLFKIIPNEEFFDNEYLYHYLKSYKAFHFFQTEMSGGAMPALSFGIVKALRIPITYLKEQQKIANFLTSIDTQIQTLEKKKSLLEQYKKGVLQKIFKQELRFKDEDGNAFPEWEVKKLGDFLVQYNEKSEYSDQYPVLTSSRKGIMFQTEYFSGNQVASKDNTGYNVVPKDYFTYRHMSDDLVFKFNKNTICDKGIVSTLYPVFTTENIDDNFLEYKLNEGLEIRRYALLQKQGGSRTYLYFKKLANMKMNMPSVKEQTKIADFLSAIDKNIDLVNTKIEHTKAYKKGLLQQMFV